MFKAGLIAVGISLALPDVGWAEKWDMPMAYSASNYHSKNGKKFADCVNKNSEDIEMKTHPGGLLYRGDEIKQAVEKGYVKIGERLISAHADENPLFGLDSVPFLATSFEASDKLWLAASNGMQEALGKQGLVYIYSVPWPPQGLYIKKEINALSDLSGVTLRTYNAATQRIAELSDMLPVHIDIAELSKALADGAAQSFISSGSTGFERKIWKQLTHFYDVQAWVPRNVVFANRKAWEKISDKARQAILSCGKKAEKRGGEKAREVTEFYLKGLASRGMQVMKPNDKLKVELDELGAVMSREWSERAGAAGKSILEAYNQR